MTKPKVLQWDKTLIPQEWYDLIAQQWSPPPDSELAAWRSNFLLGKAATAKIRELFTGTDPVSVVSLGDSDVIAMCPEALVDVPGLNKEFVLDVLRCGGITYEDSFVLRDDYLAAVRNSPVYVLMYWWVPVEMVSVKIFKHFGLDPANPGKPKIDGNAVYSMNKHGDFFPCFDGKRVLVVGGMSEKVARVLSDESFQDKHKQYGIEKGYKIVGFVDTPKRADAPKRAYLPAVYSAIDAFDGQYDFALVSGGTMAFFYCEHIRKKGKQAFDYGSIEREILGERHSIGGMQFDVPEAVIRY